MSLNRWAKRKDTTQPEIREALHGVGAITLVLDEFDLLVFFRERLYMLDCKSKGGKATHSQKDLVKKGWPLRFAETPEEALRAIGAVK